MCALFGPDVRCPTPQHILGVGEETLRGAGLSRAKALAVTDLAVKVDQGLIPPLDEPRGMDDERVIACLTQVRGIGWWTAEMLLIFRLGRPDVPVVMTEHVFDKIRSIDMTLAEFEQLLGRGRSSRSMRRSPVDSRNSSW